MMRQYELVERVREYDPGVDENLLNRAYVFAMKQHGSQKRASGDPYFSHPLEVAGILTDMRLDGYTIATALLHDVVEDTDTTTEEIGELFGSEVAKLVEGVTKLSKIELQTESERQAENFRKFLLALSDDIRVLLIKLADRLHNMQTIHHIGKPEKRRRIAIETMEIYAPLAERIGIRHFKDELEDIAFREINPEAYETVMSRLEYLRDKGGEIVQEICTTLRDILKQHGITAQVFGREKTPYSIWAKMERNHITFEELADIIAFRVLVDDVETCYQALGVVHQSFAMIHGQFDDYISTPKRNGYQSIHTAVIGPDNYRIEVQIRTHEMHDIAEHGVAAHWRYKKAGKQTDGVQYKWVRELLEILEEAASPEEFLEHTKLEMFQDQVFCFTPKGDLISLPRGSTVVDFAYAVHSMIGDTCVGAKVNGRPVPLRHILANGDQVEITRSKVRKPSPKWESFVITGRARAAIKRFMNKQQRSEYIQLGRSIIERAFKLQEIDFSTDVLAQNLDKFEKPSVDDIFIDVGRGFLSEGRLLNILFPGTRFKGLEKGRPEPVSDWVGEDAQKELGIPIRGLTPGVAVHLSDCCHPLPGDRIIGVVNKGQGVMVHTMDCETLLDMDDDPDGWLNLTWQAKDEEADFYTARLNIIVANEAGALATIAQTVANNGGNISNLKIPTRDKKFFTFVMDVEVKNLNHVKGIIAALRALTVISSVDRG